MPLTPWVLRLIIANALVFLLEQNMPGLVYQFALVPGLIPQQPWTIVTYMFLHGSWGHIIFNMLSLFFFGPRVEMRLGGPHFLGLYLFSGLAGAALSMITPMATIIGASGAVVGVCVAYAMFWPHDRVFIWGILPVPAWALVVLYIAMALFGFGGAGIAHYAHLGGIVGAFLYLKWAGRNSALVTYRKKLRGRGPAVLERDDLQRWAAIPREGLHEVNRDEVDRLLTKVREHGARSLTHDERAFLDRMAPR